MQKPSIPKGTRDFSPTEMQGRDYIFNTIRKIFQVHGYQPIETPAMENLSTLLGKYGEEGDKLLFKILNSGDFLQKSNKEALNNNDSNQFSSSISEKGLRYDLTVPFARYVVQHRNEISFPFKRYQIQPVWRADRPQKGRFREFFQCDADVIGSNSLLNETELIQIIDTVFESLNLNVSVKLNNRKILTGIADIVGKPELLIPITVAIDKLDKIGEEKVMEELMERGLTENDLQTIRPILFLTGNNNKKLDALSQILKESEAAQQGILELREILKYLENYSLKNSIEIDLTLARGLNYYTGTIIEVKSLDVNMGSICGGGRYDDLTGIFGLKDVSGVGISFGADRIYEVLKEIDKFPNKARQSVLVMFTNFGTSEATYCLPYLQQLRQKGIASELYPDDIKISKQLDYANKNDIQWVVIAGEDEVKNGLFTLKNMHTGTQETFSAHMLIEKFTY
jgi:histidyl-tRNA synthetase